MSPVIEELLSKAFDRGLTVVDKGNGHYKISGKDDIVVNYWPESKNRTAHVDGTKAGVKHCTPAAAIQLALVHPKNRDLLVRKHTNKPAEPVGSQIKNAFGAMADKVKGVLPWVS